MTATATVDTGDLVAALKNAGFGGSVVRVQNAVPDAVAGDEPGKQTSDTPPLAALPSEGPPLDEPPARRVGTIYSSNSFSQHVQVSAYLDHDVLRPGDVFRIAVVFDIAEGWHIYGNPLGPGIGKETLVSVKVRDRFEFEPARYAPAHRQEQDFGEAGKTWVWEHSGQTIHFLAGQVGDAAEPGRYRLTIEATAQVCTTGACLPGQATVELPVTVVPAGSPSNPANGELFAGFNRAVPPPETGSRQ